MGCARNAQEVCDGIDNNCNGEVDENACPEKCTGFVADGKSYMACMTSTSENKGAAECEAQGMRLVWIDSAQQNAALLAEIERIGIGPGYDQSAIFIGATDAEQEGHWHWIGGADFWLGGSAGMPLADAYVNWGAGRPNQGTNENCAVMQLTLSPEGMPGEWNDAPCNQVHGALCETP
jgi:hypothetical protein